MKNVNKIRQNKPNMACIYVCNNMYAVGRIFLGLVLKMTNAIKITTYTIYIFYYAKQIITIIIIIYDKCDEYDSTSGSGKTPFI